MDTIFHTLWVHGNNQGDAPMLIDGEGGLPWRRLMQTVNSVCLGLVYRGLRTGRSVAVLLQANRYQVLAPLAVLRGRGVVVPLNPALGPKAMETALNRSRPEILLYDHTYRNQVRELESIHPFRTLICMGGSPPEGHIDWEELAATETAGAAYPEILPDTPAFHRSHLTAEHHLQTVITNERNLILGAHSAIRRCRFTPEDRHLTLGITPSEASAQSLRSLLSGGCLVLYNTLNPKAVFALLREHRVTALRVPPFLLRTLSEWQLAAQEDDGSLRLIECCGTPPASTIRMAQDAFGDRLALTRTHPFAHDAVLGPKEVASIPRDDQPCPGYVIQVTGPNGRPALSDHPGELWIRSNLLAPALLEDFGRIEIPREEKGWFRTGLLARTTAAGEVALLGPLESVLERQGRIIIPRETETALEEHPDVVQAICVTIREKKNRNYLIALVQRTKEEGPTAEALSEWLRQRLHPAQIPNPILMAPRFPHLPSGEVDRKRLQLHLQEVLKKKG